jgi:hypothetical protein
MRRVAAAFASIAFALAGAACTRAQTGPAGAAPSVPPPLPGTEPIRIVAASPVPVARPSASTVFDTTFPAALRNARIAASENGVAFVVTGKHVHAVDLATGTERWVSADDVGAENVAAGDRLVFAGRQTATGSDLVAYDVGTGRRVLTLPEYDGFVVDGVLYAHGRQSLTAYDASDGHRIWRTLGAGGGIGQPPVLVGTTLLQDFTDSGATLVNSIYAFDIRDGHVRWAISNGPHPIGYGDGIIYVNTTWCGSMQSCFHSLDVDAVDLTTGKSRTHVSYLLDDVTDTAANGGMIAAVEPHVAGGFAYFGLHGRWYRYDADRDPAHGHGVRLEGVTPRAWFDDGAMLVTRGGELDVARSYADRVELHAVASGALRSDVVVRVDGTRYAVAGEQLLAIERSANSARAFGRVPCAAIADVIVWGARIAVRCAADRRGAERVLGFDDALAVAAAAPAPHARPLAPPAGAFVAKVHRFPNALPERGDTADIAVAPDGSLALVLVLDRGIFESRDAVGRVTPGGAVTLVPLPATAHQNERLEPRAVAVDRSGTIWFDDRRDATLTALERGGGFTTYRIGEPRPPETDDRLPRRISPTVGIRLAIGPDGEAWFARTRPTPQVGHVRGGPRYDIPPEVGAVDQLARGGDGTLWYRNRTLFGRITASGAFTHAPLPVELTVRGAGVVATELKAGPGKTMWLMNNSTIVQTDGASVLRTIALPNATTYVYDAVTACDGSLYVAETVPQIAHVLPNGHIDEYPVDGFLETRHLARGADCRIWLSGSGNGRPELATFELVPTPSAPAPAPRPSP